MSILRRSSSKASGKASETEALLEKRVRRMSDEIRSLREDKRHLTHDLEGSRDDLARERRVRLHGDPHPQS